MYICRGIYPPNYGKTHENNAAKTHKLLHNHRQTADINLPTYSHTSPCLGK